MVVSLFLWGTTNSGSGNASNFFICSWETLSSTRMVFHFVALLVISHWFPGCPPIWVFFPHTLLLLSYSQPDTSCYHSHCLKASQNIYSIPPFQGDTSISLSNCLASEPFWICGLGSNRLSFGLVTNSQVMTLKLNDCLDILYRALLYFAMLCSVDIFGRPAPFWR